MVAYIASMPQWYMFVMVLSLLLSLVFFALVIVVGDDFRSVSDSKLVKAVFGTCATLCAACCIVFVLLFITWISASVAATFANPGA